MKTQILTFAALLLISFNVSAKMNTSNSNNEIRISEITNSTIIAEEELSIENWMTNDYIWNLASSKLKVDGISDEEPLRIADWMTDSAQWLQNVNRNFSAQTNFENDEEPLSIEGWMTNDESWSL